MRRPTQVMLGLAGFLLLQAGGGVTPNLAAQFGQNRVQYETFDFQVLRTEHFDIYHYPEEREAAQLAGRMAERWYARLSRMLSYEFTKRQPIVMYANHLHFQQNNIGAVGEGTGGFAEYLKRRIVLPFAGGLRETNHVLGHELVHGFQYAITGEGRNPTVGQAPGIARLPLWFVEGMAEYLSVGPRDPHTAMWLRDGMQHDLPTIAQMTDPQAFFPYRFGQAFWAWVGGRYGDEVVGRLLKTAGRAQDPQLTMARILGGSAEELSEWWHTSVRNAYGPLQEATRPPSEYGQEILAEKDVLASAPALSADGRYIAYISSRDLFSLEIFLAEVETGRVIRKLTQTALDPHFESLQFITSAGTWSPDGRTFALAGVTRGKPVISLIDVASGDRTRDIRLPELGEVHNPTWSPDGRSIAFSAIVGGLSDLFVYDLEADQLRRLTNDPYADLQPQWAPDGRRLAFLTDRFTTDLDLLDFGAYRISLLEATTGAISEVPGLPEGDQTNAQWAPNGDLFFVSTRTGIANLYRLSPETGSLRQVTNLFIGVTGITPLSPAVTVARDTGTLVFLSQDEGFFRMYHVTDETLLAGRPLEPPFASGDPAALPPSERISDELATVLANPRIGLPDTAEFATRPYPTRLSLDYVSQPTILFGANQWGTYLGGGAQVGWSDMLGNRYLQTTLFVNGGIKDISAAVGYYNLKHRFNWGLAVQNVPTTYRYLTGLGEGTFNGELVQVQEVTLFRQTNREIFGVGQYAFSRAQRVEFSIGARHIDFDQEIQRRGISLSGDRVIDTTIVLDTFDPLLFATGSAAMVYDQTIFGATGPILGQRYRIEASPVVGSLNYVGALGDYRRYFMPVRPFTIGLRLLHFGRYGGGAEDERLRPLYIGFPGMVRGYDDRSFGPDDCAAATTSDPCPLFSRLLGSRMILGNAELRFPLFGVLGIGSGYYGLDGYLPLDFVIFGDAGLAWGTDDGYTLTGAPTPDTDERAFFLGGDRKPVYSAGAGVRLNLLGALILELDYAYAFQRKAWLWQFSFVPGF